MADYLATNEVSGTGAIMTVNIDFKGVDPDVGSGAVPYIEVDDVLAAIVTPATETAAESEVPVGLTYIGPTTFRTNASVPVGKTLRVYRASQDEYGLVQFQALQNVTENDLDLLARQILYVAMETKDVATRATISAAYSDSLARLALQTANGAVLTAGQAVVTANQAFAASQAAVSTANAASSTANQAVTIANNALDGVQDAVVAANEATAAAEAATAAAAQAVIDATEVVNAATVRFLAPRTVNPALRDDGTPLQTGDRYLNTTDGIEYIYQSGSWVANNLDGAALANPDTGATLVGYDGVTVADFLSMAKPFANYAAVRAYGGPAQAGRILDTDTGGDWKVNLASIASDNGIDVLVDVVGRRWERQYSGPIDIRWAGAKSDNSTDVKPIIQACCTVQSGRGGGAVLIPDKTYRAADTSVSVKPGNYVTIMGLGEASCLFWDDRVDNPVRQDLIDVSNTVGVTLKAFRINGTLATYPTETNQKNAIVGTNARNIRMDSVTLTNLRFMAINIHYVRGGVFDKLVLSDVMRDGIRVTHSQDVVIRDPKGTRVADDVIACHMLDASTAPVGQGLVISGGRFEACQGVKVLGAKLLTISDCVWRRSIRNPLVISNNYDLEGNTPMFAINIHDVHFFDSFNLYRSTLSDVAISLVFRNRSAGSLASPTRPGVNAPTFAYSYLNDNDASGAVNIGVQGINVHDFTIARTIPTTGQLYSTLGYGNILDRKGGSADEGYFDPVLADGFFDVHGIRVFGPVKGLKIHHGQFYGGGVNKSAIIVDSNDSVGVTTVAAIESCQFFDWPGIGVDLNRTAWASRMVSVKNCQFDLDPYFRHPDHAADNTWTAVPAAGAVGCMAIRAGASGFCGSADGNEFKHMATICDSPTRILWGQDNTAIWQNPPSGTGLDGNAANKGIRFVSSAIPLMHIIYNGDPASTGFENITGGLPRTVAIAMPTSGTYVLGHYTRNTSTVVLGTAGSRYIIRGWLRLTTGATHVAGTDWQEDSLLTGT